MNHQKWEKFYFELEAHLAAQLETTLKDKHMRVKLLEETAQPVHPHFQMEKHWAKSRRTFMIHPDDAQEARSIIDHFFEEIEEESEPDPDISEYANTSSESGVPPTKARLNWLWPVIAVTSLVVFILVILFVGMK